MGLARGGSPMLTMPRISVWHSALLARPRTDPMTAELARATCPMLTMPRMRAWHIALPARPRTRPMTAELARATRRLLTMPRMRAWHSALRMPRMFPMVTVETHHPPKGVLLREKEFIAREDLGWHEIGAEARRLGLRLSRAKQYRYRGHDSLIATDLGRPAPPHYQAPLSARGVTSLVSLRAHGTSTHRTCYS